MLLAFQEHLEYGNNRRNTVTFTCTLRALYYRARRGDTLEDGNPFLGISFRPARTDKLAVSQSLLQTLCDFQPRRTERSATYSCSFYAECHSSIWLTCVVDIGTEFCIINVKGGRTTDSRIIPKLKAILSRYDDPVGIACMSRVRLIGHPQEVQDGNALRTALQSLYPGAANTSTCSEVSQWRCL